MMHSVNFDEVLERILAEETRYHRNAYTFIREGLDYTVQRLQKPHKGPKRHVSGRELLDGLRLFSLEQLGPMAKTVFNRWGIHTTRDIGEMVFILVSHGILGKTDDDHIEDFDDGFDFDEAFRRPFQPRSRHPRPEPVVPHS
ncbi:MAG: hypothetical protein PHP44_02035 [Kiritimatiellae bacterium]|nr:hypothetical protein [Kiritimatiellia bacterium]